MCRDAPTGRSGPETRRDADTLRQQNEALRCQAAPPCSAPRLRLRSRRPGCAPRNWHAGVARRDINMQTHLNDQRRRAAQKQDPEEETWTVMRSGKLTHVVPGSLKAHCDRCTRPMGHVEIRGRVARGCVWQRAGSCARWSLTLLPCCQRGCGNPAGPAGL